MIATIAPAAKTANRIAFDAGNGLEKLNGELGKAFFPPFNSLGFDWTLMAPFSIIENRIHRRNWIVDYEQQSVVDRALFLIETWLQKIAQEAVHTVATIPLS
jgi:hypothetical protein